MAKKRTTGLSTVSQAERAVSLMEKPLKAAYKEVAAAIAEASSGALTAYRKIGEWVNQVSTDEEYQVGAIKLLADATGIGIQTLYRARGLFEGYTPAEFKELCNAKTAVGSRLSWTHTLVLLSVPDKKARKKFQDQALEGCWTVEQLQKAVNDKYGNRREGSGPKFVKPKTVMQGLGNLCEFTGEFLTRSDKIWNRTIEELAEIPVDAFTDVDVERLQSLVERQTTAIRVYEQQRADCSRILEGLNGSTARLLGHKHED